MEERGEFIGGGGMAETRGDTGFHRGPHKPRLQGPRRAGSRDRAGAPLGPRKATVRPFLTQATALTPRTLQRAVLPPREGGTPGTQHRSSVVTATATLWL